MTFLAEFRFRCIHGTDYRAQSVAQSVAQLLGSESNRIETLIHVVKYKCLVVRYLAVNQASIVLTAVKCLWSIQSDLFPLIPLSHSLSRPSNRQ
jgi:hypothetical protein